MRLAGTLSSLFATIAAVGSSTRARIITRSSTTSQPTAMRPRSVSSMWRSWKARSMTTVLATDRARPNTMPAIHDQPSACVKPAADQGGDDDLDDRAGHGDARHRHQVLEREVQADAEHQQDHADLGELAGQRGVGGKPGVNGPTTTPASR